MFLDHLRKKKDFTFKMEFSIIEKIRRANVSCRQSQFNKCVVETIDLVSLPTTTNEQFKNPNPNQSTTKFPVFLVAK